MKTQQEAEENVICCSKCGNTPEDVLILTCDHNLCLSCAAANLRREQEKSKHSFQTVVCDICGSATVLDPSSATELLTLITPEDHPSHPSTIHSNPIQKNQELPKESASEISRKAYQTGSSCKTHPDEEVKYFCFDCLCPPVCPECVVHGIHKGHEVLNIRKALPLVREKIDGIIQGLMNRAGELETNIEEIQIKKRTIAENADAAKSQANEMLEDIKGLLDKKAKQIDIEIESNIEENNKDLDNCQRLVGEKLESITKNIQFIQSHLAESPEETLSFYAENNKALLQVLDQEAKEKFQFSAMLTGNKVPGIDVESLKQFRESIGIIGEEIAKLRINPFVSSRIEKGKEGKSKTAKDGLYQHTEEPSYQTHLKK